ncbi:hypothetical protein [Pseudoclavibacter sp. VKM Ac-2888]|uniref:hypothetical protein n=1 Tax=Pseudoclavibacter sp. VKM Ac-2888 TaxID=2783830 RepID=UPI00188A3626|nr:hypothetical protein [Pseudoclavibacter sp. VKM Ac-2888]MBF4549226.1 hypothetical protein [Pseudoclavibacter sp. VKM Ac-2888]
MSINVKPLGGGGTTRIPEDILAEDGGVLVRRGRLLFQYDHTTGFPLVRQHYENVWPRNPLSIGGYPKGLIVTGRGAAADGYGSRNSGAAMYLNHDRFQEGTWFTLSGRFSLMGETAGAVAGFGAHMDMQAWDDTRRAYPKVHFDDTRRQWEIQTNQGTYVDVPGATYFPGFNEQKFDNTYIAFSFRSEKSTPAQPHPATFGSYGHLQIGGRSFDLRGLGAGWSNYAPQVGTPEDSFAGGQNYGFSASTPLPGQIGGFVLTRMEVTVGDVLN